MRSKLRIVTAVLAGRARAVVPGDESGRALRAG